MGGERAAAAALGTALRGLRHVGSGHPLCAGAVGAPGARPSRPSAPPAWALAAPVLQQRRSRLPTCRLRVPSSLPPRPRRSAPVAAELWGAAKRLEWDPCLAPLRLNRSQQAGRAVLKRPASWVHAGLLEFSRLAAPRADPAAAHPQFYPRKLVLEAGKPASSRAAKCSAPYHLGPSQQWPGAPAGTGPLPGGCMPRQPGGQWWRQQRRERRRERPRPRPLLRQVGRRWTCMLADASPAPHVLLLIASQSPGPLCARRGPAMEHVHLGVLHTCSSALPA